MDDITKTIEAFYDQTVQDEWMRIYNRPEYFITLSFMEKYINPGDSLLDIGGGPGRYSLHFAQKGCKSALADLSKENVAFAKEKAKEIGVSLQALQADARGIDEHFPPASFDHVFLMGPLYHLLKEEERIKAVHAALTLLKPGGLLFVSFISTFAGMVFSMNHAPQTILAPVGDQGFVETALQKEDFQGFSFTQSFFIQPKNILPFMSSFSLEKLHLFGQESILSPCENQIFSQSQEVIDQWLALGQALAEKEEFFSWAEHIMYIGRKIKE